MRLRSLLIGMALLLALSGCGGSSPEPVVAEGNAVLPLATVEDLVTYGDFGAVATVTDERRLPALDEEESRGEGLIPRQVTMRVDDIVWRRPTLGEKGALPTTLTLTNGGWEFGEHGERPWIVSGQERLDVGRRYFVMEAFGNAELGSIAAGATPTGTPEWMALVAMPLKEDTVVKSDSDRVAEGVARFFAGRSVAGAAQLLQDTPIDPAAAPYMDEDPVVRYHEARAAAATPAG